MAIEYAPLNAL